MIGTWPSGVSLRTSTDGSATITYTSGVVYSEEGYDVTIKCTKNHYSTQMTVHLKTWGVPYQI
jgi:hypothetical protein